MEKERKSQFLLDLSFTWNQKTRIKLKSPSMSFSFFMKMPSRLSIRTRHLDAEINVKTKWNLKARTNCSCLFFRSVSFVPLDFFFFLFLYNLQAAANLFYSCFYFLTFWLILIVNLCLKLSLFFNSHKFPFDIWKKCLPLWLIAGVEIL